MADVLFRWMPSGNPKRNSHLTVRQKAVSRMVGNYVALSFERSNDLALEFSHLSDPVLSEIDKVTIALRDVANETISFSQGSEMRSVCRRGRKAGCSVNNGGAEFAMLLQGCT